MADTADVTVSDPSQPYSDFETLTAALEGMVDPNNRSTTAAVRVLVEAELAKGAGASVRSVCADLEALAALALESKRVLEGSH